MRDFVVITKALSDENRVRIVKMLERDELCVCEITARLGLAPSTVSKHLSLLRAAGLVADRKQGLWVYYRLEETALNPHTPRVLALLQQVLNEDPTIVADAASLAACCNAVTDTPQEEH